MLFGARTWGRKEWMLRSTVGLDFIGCVAHIRGGDDLRDNRNIHDSLGACHRR